ncbi:MAG TPA: NAD(P)H-dependent oxidoreductase [Candidatus Saccharimonadales bacterium]|nr:NAD(P)H-dependent oxidoreductase [Candidatus Saccharimonadales bacterium]
MEGLRVLGISTTTMNQQHPRPSTSETLLEHALEHAKKKHGAEINLIRARELKIRHCEGYYSKALKSCTWPCNITQTDPTDEMKKIYDGIVDWADVVIVATPLRWGNACSLYYEMVQRMNCIQNQIPAHGRYLIKDKVAAFIITGGQDGVQHVAGEMLMFWSELGFVFGKFPFVGWSRGWYAEDTQNNYTTLKTWEPRFQAATPTSDTESLVDNAIEMTTLLKTRKPLPSTST